MSIELTTLLIPLAVAVTGFILIWPVSVWRRDASVVDIAWGPGFLVQLAVVAWIIPQTGPRSWVLLAVIGTWSLRLGWVIIRRRIREGHEDPRYTSVRRSWGNHFWLKSLFGVFVLQAFIQWLLVIGPIGGMAAADQDIGLLSTFGIVLGLTGLSLETVADHQLDRFKQNAENQSRLLMHGLRAYVRHPNYLGEVVFWIGIALIILEAGAWIGLLSPVLILLLLTKVSGLPLLDERLGETRPEYTEYRSRVPALVPRLWSERR